MWFSQIVSNNLFSSGLLLDIDYFSLKICSHPLADNSATWYSKFWCMVQALIYPNFILIFSPITCSFQKTVILKWNWEWYWCNYTEKLAWIHYKNNGKTVSIQIVIWLFYNEFLINMNWKKKWQTSAFCWEKIWCFLQK